MQNLMNHGISIHKNETEELPPPLVEREVPEVGKMGWKGRNSRPVVFLEFGKEIRVDWRRFEVLKRNRRCCWQERLLEPGWKWLLVPSYRI